MSSRFSRAMATADAARRARPALCRVCGETMTVRTANGGWFCNGPHKPVVDLPVAHANPWPRQGVHKISQYVWLVPSRTHPGDFHTVEWHHNETDRIYFTCTCPAGHGGHTKMGDPGRGHGSCCRHVAQVAEAEKDDGQPDRPAAVIGDTGRFVD